MTYTITEESIKKAIEWIARMDEKQEEAHIMHDYDEERRLGNKSSAARRMFRILTGADYREIDDMIDSAIDEMYE